MRPSMPSQASSRRLAASKRSCWRGLGLLYRQTFTSKMRNAQSAKTYARRSKKSHFMFRNCSNCCAWSARQHWRVWKSMSWYPLLPTSTSGIRASFPELPNPQGQWNNHLAYKALRLHPKFWDVVTGEGRDPSKQDDKKDGSGQAVAPSQCLGSVDRMSSELGHPFNQNFVKPADVASSETTLKRPPDRKIWALSLQSDKLCERAMKNVGTFAELLRSRT